MVKKEWAATCKRMKRIVRKDASLKHRYEHKGKNCVIGGLAKAARIMLPINDKNGNPIERLLKFAAQLYKAYPGLTMAKLRALQKINDYWDTTRGRRKRLIEEIKKWTQ